MSKRQVKWLESLYMGILSKQVLYVLYSNGSEDKCELGGISHMVYQSQLNIKL